MVLPKILVLILLRAVRGPGRVLHARDLHLAQACADGGLGRISGPVSPTVGSRLLSSASRRGDSVHLGLKIGP